MHSQNLETLKITVFNKIFGLQFNVHQNMLKEQKFDLIDEEDISDLLI